jgi:IS5 family transposase
MPLSDANWIICQSSMEVNLPAASDSRSTNTQLKEQQIQWGARLAWDYDAARAVACRPGGIGGGRSDPAGTRPTCKGLSGSHATERTPGHGQQSLLRSRLDQTVDPAHALVKLAGRVDWRFLERRFDASSADRPGRPPLPMAGLAILKHTHDLSDEALCERWVATPPFKAIYRSRGTQESTAAGCGLRRTPTF